LASSTRDPVGLERVNGSALDSGLRADLQKIGVAPRRGAFGNAPEGRVNSGFE